MSCIAPIKLIEEDRVVPCGGCNFCLSRRRSDWSVRLFNHFMDSFNAFFVTLTYDDDHIVYGSEATGTLEREVIKTLHHSLRKINARATKSRESQGQSIFKDGKGNSRRIQYYTVGEYGSEGARPHYHSIIFNVYPETLRKLAEGSLWNKGMIKVGSVTHASINYVTKYVIDRDTHSDCAPFSMMSKGLGVGYLERNSAMHTRGQLKGYVVHQGRRVAMPRYYRDKIFTEFEREYLTIEGMKEMDNRYFEELDRLIAMDVYRPADYIEERKQRDHDQIRIKSIKLNTI